jgi:hypothetical protein
MRLSELIKTLRPARFSDKSGALLWGTSNGQDVALPYIQAGWVNVADGQYTAGSPLSVTANVKTQITIDGNGATTNRSYANGMQSDVWSDNRFKPADIGECYTLRLTAVLTQSSSGSGHFALFEADIGTDEVPFISAAQPVPLIKGQGNSTVLTIAAPFFTLATFGLRGARLFITPSVNVTLHSAAIFIQRTFKP